tara:strand:+ start:8868 stop:9638 length:771 start_codon:yes stop_codon:yes gene_type:complete
MKKVKNSKYIQIVLLFWLSFSALNAQDETENLTEAVSYKPIDFNLQVKNMHLWRGLRVTDAPMTGALLHYTSKNGKLDAGFWGGAGFNGDYTEVDYYISYTTHGFSIALWDINNYSDFPEAEIFDYDTSTTSHFVDLTLAYTFQKIPLKASWSTILLGRDSYLTDDGELENTFTNYVELSYNIFKKKHSSLGVSIAGAFSFVNDAHFYGDKVLNNFGIIYSRDVKVYQDIYLPVSVTALWNTDQKFASIQVAINLF